MSSRLFLQTQSELVDSCLAELAHLPNSDVVNFNNTAQFDMLLRHLELSFVAPTFCQVPSVYVLHVLVTLAARCPESNWSHDPGLGAVASSTEYMRRVNCDYDACLGNSSLSYRSTLLLQKYLHLVSVSSSLSAVKLLSDNMFSVFSQIAPHPNIPAKSPRKTRSATKSKTKNVHSEDVLGGLYAVEVISDSEDSDCPIEVPHAGASASVQEYRNVISLSELAAKTSGLGEVATLFKDMPHLSAQATPEPESGPEVPTKKRRSDASLWRRMQVYDDDVLASRLNTDYTFWDLVRWMFWCADSSSQYQKFLFNSNSTCVHSCYMCYAGIVEIFVGLSAAQMAVSHASPLWASLHLQSHEKTVETIFSGLDSVFRNKPFPCYKRELILLAHDPAVRVSQCKTTLGFDDNMHSMGLRVTMLTLFSYYERNISKRRPDILSLMQKKTTGDRLMFFAVEKVRNLSVQYTKGFFEAQIKIPFLKDYAEVFMINLALAVLAKMTDVEVCIYDSLNGKFSDDVMRMISNKKLYCGITEDLSTPSLEAFFEKWNKMVFLAEWVMWPAIYRSDTDYTQMCSTADKLSQLCVREFLQSRCDDADLIEDSAFTVPREEMEETLARAQSRFLRIVQQK